MQRVSRILDKFYLNHAPLCIPPDEKAGLTDQDLNPVYFAASLTKENFRNGSIAVSQNPKHVDYQPFIPTVKVQPANVPSFLMCKGVKTSHGSFFLNDGLVYKTKSLHLPDAVHTLFTNVKGETFIDDGQFLHEEDIKSSSEWLQAFIFTEELLSTRSFTSFVSSKGSIADLPTNVNTLSPMSSAFEIEEMQLPPVYPHQDSSFNELILSSGGYSDWPLQG